MSRAAPGSRWLAVLAVALPAALAALLLRASFDVSAAEQVAFGAVVSGVLFWAAWRGVYQFCLALLAGTSLSMVEMRNRRAVDSSNRRTAQARLERQVRPCCAVRMCRGRLRRSLEEVRGSIFRNGSTVRIVEIEGGRPEY